jgi:hypothetical protein
MHEYWLIGSSSSLDAQSFIPVIDEEWRSWPESFGEHLSCVIWYLVLQWVVVSS